MCPHGKYAVVDRLRAFRIFVEMLAFFLLEACRSTTDIADVDILCSDSTECFTFPENVNYRVRISTSPVLFLTELGEG